MSNKNGCPYGCTDPSCPVTLSGYLRNGKSENEEFHGQFHEQFDEPQKRVRDVKTANELKESLSSFENFNGISQSEIKSNT